jgi:hypothetical protein
MKRSKALCAAPVATLALILAACAPAAHADGFLGYDSNHTITSYPNVTETLRTVGSTTSDMWAVAYMEPNINDVNNGPALHIEYFRNTANGAMERYQSTALLEGGDADNVGNPDKAAPIPIAQGGRLSDDGSSVSLTTNVYTVWTEKTGATSQLVCALVNNGTQESIPGNNDQQTISVVHPLITGLAQGATSFGASALPDGSGFVTVTVKTGKTAATVTYFKWDSSVDTYSLRQAFQEDIALPSGLTGAYNGNIVCAVTRNFDNMAQWYPYRLTISLDPCVVAGHVRTRDYRLNDKMVEGFYPTYFLTALPKDNAWHDVGGAVDNNNHVTNLIPTVSGRLLTAVGETAGMTLYARTGFDRTTQQVLWQAAGHGELLYPYTDNIPALIYRPQFPTAVNSDLVTFPVVRDMVVKNDVGNQSWDSDRLVAYEVSTALTARRRPLAPATGSVARVLGIVDGPPPIPNENFKVFGPNYASPWLAATSSVAFNWTATSAETTSTEYKSALSIGLTQSAGVSVGVFSADLEASENLESSHGSAYSRKEGSTQEQFATFANATTNDANGNTIVTPLGALYCEYQTFDGYAYDFLDTGGNPIQGAQVFTQVWPGSSNIQVLSYWMNPNGHQPGHLESYLASSAERQRLRAQSTIKFSGASSSSEGGGLGGDDHLYFGYTDGNTYGNKWDHFASDESTTTSGTKIGEALKVSAALDFEVVKVGASVEVAASNEVTNTRVTSSDTSVGVVSQCDVVTDVNVPNTYRQEYFETYLLKDDNHSLQELLSTDPDGIGLVTPTWPPIGSRMRAENETVKAELIRTSAPWKITYIIPDSNPPAKTFSLTAPAGPGAPRLDARLARKLASYGVTTTGAADILIQKHRQMRPAPANLLTNVPPFVRSQEAAKKTLQLHGFITRAFPNRGRFDSAVRHLTNVEIAQLKAYEKACESWSRQAYAKAHPVRYPAFTPDSILRKPAVVNRTGSHYTEIPPAGL